MNALTSTALYVAISLLVWWIIYQACLLLFDYALSFAPYVLGLWVSAAYDREKLLRKKDG